MFGRGSESSPREPDAGLSSGALRAPELKKASRGAGALRAPASAKDFFEFCTDFCEFPTLNVLIQCFLIVCSGCTTRRCAFADHAMFGRALLKGLYIGTRTAHSFEAACPRRSPPFRWRSYPRFSTQRCLSSCHLVALIWVGGDAALFAAPFRSGWCCVAASED